jgi:hypothetical protein
MRTLTQSVTVPALVDPTNSLVPNTTLSDMELKPYGQLNDRKTVGTNEDVLRQLDEQKFSWIHVRAILIAGVGWVVKGRFLLELQIFYGRL